MKMEFSAGGIVYKKDAAGKYLILLAQHSHHHGWVFPKGLIGDKVHGESKEATALREVTEETGAIGAIKTPLKPIAYWYVWEGEKRKKTVYYFIMEYVSGDISKHDFEMEDVQWIPFAAVEKTLTYAGDKNVWKEAKEILTNGGIA